MATATERSSSERTLGSRSEVARVSDADLDSSVRWNDDDELESDAGY